MDLLAFNGFLLLLCSFGFLKMKDKNKERNNDTVGNVTSQRTHSFIEHLQPLINFYITHLTLFYYYKNMFVHSKKKGNGHSCFNFTSETRLTTKVSNV